MSRDLWVLAGFLTLCFSCEAVASYFTLLGIEEWYPLIIKPSWAIPEKAYSPIWTFLFGLLAVAGWFAWREAGSLAKAPFAFGFFSAQVACTTLWPLFFFSWHNLWLSYAVALGLIIASVSTIYYFYRLSSLSAYLLIPNFLWALFAALLNFQIAILNS